jgi:hypothetical protein
MDRKSMIIQEMKKSSSWTRYLLKSFDSNKEFEIPTGLKANVNWQIGHILISRHFHSVLCTFGKQPELMGNIPFRDYAKHYAMGSTPEQNISDKPSIITMMDELYQVDKKAVELIEAMDESDLEEAPLRDHPVAKTRYESMMWSAQHQMWHNGQVAMIKSLISES